MATRLPKRLFPLVLAVPVLTLAMCEGQGGGTAMAASDASSAPQAGANDATTINLPSFAPLAKRLTPSVVNISSTTVVRRQLPYGHPDLGENPFLQPFERFFGEPGRGRLEKMQSLGSGFVLDKEGHIITNNHVIAGADEVVVMFPESEREFKAKVVGADKLTDLALLKIDAPKSILEPVVLGDSDNVQVGDWVVAIGNPFGLNSTVTQGIISALGRRLTSSSYESFLQTDASINPGNSGGPLVNLQGQVIAVNTAIYSRSGGNIGIGFAIPINIAKNVVEQLKAHGKVIRGWLGVVIQPVTPNMAQALGLPKDEGALVADVVQNGPAAKAGIKAGDVIVGWNGKPVKESDELPLLVSRTKPGTEAKITVIRDGKRKDIDVKVGELQSKEEEQKGVETGGQLGLTVQPLTPDIAQQLGLSSTEGVVVTQVVPGSAADNAGLQTGDVIVQLGDHPVRDMRDYEKALRELPKNKPVLVRAKRGQATLFFALKP